MLAYWDKVEGAADYSKDCVSHSYGLVQNFFKSSQCKWVFRVYLALFSNTDGPAPAVLIALSWVNMPTIASAFTYMDLADKWGTGNVTELSRDTGPYKDVVYSGKYYESGINGSTVWNAELQPVSSVSMSAINAILGDLRQ